MTTLIHTSTHMNLKLLDHCLTCILIYAVRAVRFKTEICH